MIDHAIDLARRSVPPALPAATADAMIRKALEHGRRKSRARVQLRWAAAAAALLLVGLAIGVRLRTPDAAPLRLQLPSGDTLTATAGARFDVRDAHPDARAVEVERGTVLFAVRPLSEGQSFEVRAGENTVRVRGTVFSVTREEGRTSVHVYEGRVEVQRGPERTAIDAGQMWEPGHLPRALEAAPLAAEGARAARAVTPTRPAPAPPSTPTTTNETPPEPAETTAEPSRVAEPRLATPDRAQVEAWVREGRFADALPVARREGWVRVEADALRGLGRLREAADAYATLARSDEHAAFRAARLRFFELDDAEGALDALDRAPRPSPLGERIDALRLRCLDRLGYAQEARAAAADYLDAYRDGGLRDFAEELLGGTPLDRAPRTPSILRE